MKVALVTGSSSGIGRGVAVALAKLGCGVIVNYASSKEEAERTAELVESAGGQALVSRADVSNPEACKSLVEQALSRWGRLDYLVNNAGTTTTSGFHEVSEEEWDRIFNVNVKGAFLLGKYGIPAMRDSGGGSFVITACERNFVTGLPKS